MLTLHPEEWFNLAAQAIALFYLPAVIIAAAIPLLARFSRIPIPSRRTRRLFLLAWLAVPLTATFLQARSSTRRAQQAFYDLLDSLRSTQSVRVYNSFIDYSANDSVEEDVSVGSPAMARLCDLLEQYRYSCTFDAGVPACIDHVTIFPDTHTSRWLVTATENTLVLGLHAQYTYSSKSTPAPNTLISQIRQTLKLGGHHHDPRTQMPD